jgi:hypothetical protein
MRRNSAVTVRPFASAAASISASPTTVDQRTARLRVTFRREPRGDTYGDWLIIHNHGQAPALRVRIAARPVEPPADATDEAIAAAALGKLPSPERIAPGGTVRHRLGTFDGVPDAYQVDLAWTHEDNSSGEWGSPVHRE